jgi:hypothetical protein
LGFLALVGIFATLAGLCAFVIDYDQESRRFGRAQARQRALRVGFVAGLFFLALGVALNFTVVR